MSVLRVLTAREAQAAAKPLLTAFEQLFPKVDINITAEYSEDADSKIDRSYIEGGPSIDYAMLQTVHDFLDGKLRESFSSTSLRPSKISTTRSRTKMELMCQSDPVG